MADQSPVPVSTHTPDISSIIRKYQHQNTPQSTADMLEVGHALIAIKDAVPHGEFINKLQELNVSISVASKMMAAARKFGSGAQLHELSVLGKTKLLELLPVEHEELEGLAVGGTLCGMTLPEIQSMTIKQLRAALKQAKCDLNAAFEDRLAVIDRPAFKSASAGAFDQGQPLQPGDRIRSLYAKRLGKVVRTYGDGSACILWDDGEPQAEGLGHERMPRELLEIIETVSAKTGVETRFEQLAPAKAAKVYHLGDYVAPKPSETQTDAKQSKCLVDEAFELSRQERRKAYCRDLCRVLLRYADDEEAADFIRSVEESIAQIMARRYAPGLNAAAYDMYARHMLKGGVQ